MANDAPSPYATRTADGARPPEGVTLMRTSLIAAILILLAGTATAQRNVTVTWMTSGITSAYDFGVSLAEDYMAGNPYLIDGEEVDVTVEVVKGPESATDRLSLYLQFFNARSTDIDVFEVDVIWPGDLAVHLADLYAFDGVREDMAAYFPSIVENNTVDGRLVAIPWYTAGGLLYYRSDLLDAYGFDGPPATWAELQTMAATIQAGERAAGNEDFWGFTWQGNAYEGLTCDALEWIASSGGGTVIHPEGVITVNNDAAIAAITRAAGWVGTISPEGSTGFQEEDARNIWQAGNAAFMRNWPYAYSLGEEAGSPIAGQFGISPLPGAEAGMSASTLGGWQIAVSEYSANKSAAAHFTRYVTGFEAQKRMAIETSRLPTIEAIYADADLLASNVAWFAELLPVFQAAVARPSTITAPVYGEASRLIFTNVHDVLTGKTDAATALAILELDLEALTGLPTAD